MARRKISCGLVRSANGSKNAGRAITTGIAARVKWEFSQICVSIRTGNFQRVTAQKETRAKGNNVEGFTEKNHYEDCTRSGLEKRQDRTAKKNANCRRQKSRPTSDKGGGWAWLSKLWFNVLWFVNHISKEAKSGKSVWRQATHNQWVGDNSLKSA